MTTENALAIAGHAVLTRIVRVRSEVFVVGTDRGGGTAARLEVADEHVDDRFTQFLPAESDTQHGSRFVEPIKAVGRANVQDDDRARICSRHGSDQRRLTAGKFPQIPIATLRLPVVVGPDDDDGNVAFRGQGRRFAHEITFDNGLAADDQACQEDGPLIGELDLDGDGLAGLEVDVGRHLDRAEAEEGIAALDIGGAGVDDGLAVHSQNRTTGLGEGEAMGARGLGDDRRRNARTPAFRLDPRGRRAEREQTSVGLLGDGDDVALERPSFEELDPSNTVEQWSGDRRNRAVNVGAAGVADVEIGETIHQRIERWGVVVGPDVGRAASHHPGMHCAGANHGDRAEG